MGTHPENWVREISNRILSLPHPVTGNPHILGEPVKSALLKSFAVANAQCSRSWEEVADQLPDIMTRHILVDQTQMFLSGRTSAFMLPIPGAHDHGCCSDRSSGPFGHV